MRLKKRTLHEDRQSGEVSKMEHKEEKKLLSKQEEWPYPQTVSNRPSAMPLAVLLSIATNLDNGNKARKEKFHLTYPTEGPRDFFKIIVRFVLVQNILLSLTESMLQSNWNNSLDLSVPAHLRGMRPNLTSQKDTLMLRRNSNILYF